jgi:2'-5' RNA ligase
VDQPSLFADVSAEPTDRLFFGIFPPPMVASRIKEVGEAARRRLGLRPAMLQESSFHITLIHIGDYVGLPRDAVARAEAAAEAVIAHPFDVQFDRMASFRNGPLVLLGSENDLAALVSYRQSLAAAIARTGLKTRSSLTQFKPHVTLLYDRQTQIEEQTCPPVAWRADELVLVHSLLGQTTHIALGRWPLKGF